jgi:hypothetical protein
MKKTLVMLQSTEMELPEMGERRCVEDLSSNQEAMKHQYGEDLWWNGRG